MSTASGSSSPVAVSSGCVLETFPTADHSHEFSIIRGIDKRQAAREVHTPWSRSGVWAVCGRVDRWVPAHHLAVQDHGSEWYVFALLFRDSV